MLPVTVPLFTWTPAAALEPSSSTALVAPTEPVTFSAPAPEDEPDFKALKPHVRNVLTLLLQESVLSLVNVNFPVGPPRGILWTRQSVRFYDGKVVPGKDPMGRRHFWFTVTPIKETDEGTDRWAVERGYISITPLRLDLTDEKELAIAHKQHPL